jgi:hypothetical protein
LQVGEAVTVAAGIVAVIVGILWRAYDLVAIGAGSVGLPEVLDRKRGTVQETMITRGGNMFGKRKQEAEAKIEDKRADGLFVPPEDTQVHDNQAPAQTAEEEDAIRGGRGERPTEEDE